MSCFGFKNRALNFYFDKKIYVISDEVSRLSVSNILDLK